MKPGIALFIPAILLAILLPGAAMAQNLEFSGLADFRVFNTPDEKSWLEGGLDKLRYQNQGTVEPQVHEVAGMITAHPIPEVLTYGEIRYAPGQRTPVDVTEAFARYRPVSTTPWQWSVKAGAFYPGFSLENTSIGWTSPWTLTPSALSSWVGEELRTIGSEGTVEWRGEANRITGTFALYAANDAAGTLLADRGWSFDDTSAGLFDRDRLPNAFATATHRSPPLYESPFEEIDNNVGFYGGVAWQNADFGELSAYYYDNGADASAHTNEFAWNTRFGLVGYQTNIGGFVLLAQGMAGATVVDPPTGYNLLHFQAGYVLLGHELGDWHGAWRAAARLDGYATQNDSGLVPDLSEHGHAVTAALTWRPEDWVRLTGEALQNDSWREQRTVAGLSPRERDTQFQLGIKFFY